MRPIARRDVMRVVVMGSAVLNEGASLTSAVQKRSTLPWHVGTPLPRRPNHRARHPVAARPARVGPVVVGLRMEDQRGAVGIVEFAPKRRDPRRAAVSADLDIGQVAEVRAQRVVATVLLAAGIEVSAGAGEPRAGA